MNRPGSARRANRSSLLRNGWRRLCPGRRIQRVFRVGKHIVFNLDSGAPSSSKRTPRALSILLCSGIVHLGMTGRLLVADATVPVPPHTHGILRLASGRELRFVDPRRFGRLQLQAPAAGEEQLDGGGFAGSGQEPLTISADDFAALFRNRRTPIKAALLNQKLLHGVGNIYADESLFRAGIRPRRMAGRLKRGPSLIGCVTVSRACSGKRSRSEVLPLATMWMRRERGDSSSWNTGFI